MPNFKTVDGIAHLESFRNTVGGDPKEWYVGISHDAVSRLEQHGMQSNPSASWIPCEDEQTARSIEEHFLRAGVLGDKGGGSSVNPPTQVYLFHAPRLTQFREWLRAQEAKEGDEGKRRKMRTEWVESVSRLIERCQAWLAEADSEGILELRVATQERGEIGLGRYEFPYLIINHEDTRIHIVPLARNTARTLTLAPGVEVPTEGRVDVSTGTEKWSLYRIRVEGNEHWYAVPDRGQPVLLTQDTFMAIMEELLS